MAPSTKKKTPSVIEPGCIACGTCQFIAPEIFEVTDRSRIKKNTDTAQNLERIKQAVKACPVQVIKLKEE